MTDAAPSTLGAREIVGLAIVAALVPLNSTMIAVALPDVADDLDVSTGSAGALVTIYLVVMLVGQPTAGRVIDIVGSRRALHWSLVGFVAASLATSFATAFPAVVLGRAVQAGFGAALMPAAQALVRSLSHPLRRGRSFGLLGSFIGAGAAAGPVVGGAVTAVVGWPGIFLVNVPIAGTALVLLTGLPASDGAARHDPAATGVGRVLGQRTFGAAFATNALTTLGQYGLLLSVPVVLDARGWSSGEVGLALTALTAGIVLMAPVGGRFGDVRGRRRPVVAGVGGAAVATIVAATVVESSPTALVVAITVVGFGMGFAVPSVQAAALESVPQRLAGSAAGVLSMSRYTGSIPASVLFAVLVTEGGDGSRELLAIASAAMLLALVAATLLPARVVQDAPSPEEASG